VLAITSAVFLGEPWKDHPGAVSGFIESSFNPMVYECVRRHVSSGAIRRADRTAIVLGSAFGDATTADVASRNLIAGKSRNPLLFFQSVPNSIMGHLAREYGFTGMISCITYSGNALQSMLQLAELYFNDPEIEQIVLVATEVREARSEYVSRLLLDTSDPSVSRDYAISIVVEKEIAASREGSNILARIDVSNMPKETVDCSRTTYDFAGNDGLFALVEALEQLRLSSIDLPIVLYEHSRKGDIYAIRLTR